MTCTGFCLNTWDCAAGWFLLGITAAALVIILGAIALDVWNELKGRGRWKVPGR